jgi:lipoprotein NlpD
LRALTCIVSLAVALQLTACAPISPAPVVNGWSTTAGKSSQYIVQPGDTIYSIAWVFGVSYKKIAELNDLDAQYSLQGVRYLTMPPASDSTFKAQVASSDLNNPPVQVGSVQATQAQPSQAATAKPRVPTRISTTQQRWVWPLRGKIVAAFKSGNPPNKGIDIATEYATPVAAAAAGEVVYSGSGLQGYGNLIIIKHKHDVMTAYAYNSKLLVKLGSNVRAGQKIAEAGRGPNGLAMLHFEIRDDATPVNPLRLLPK